MHFLKEVMIKFIWVPFCVSLKTTEGFCWYIRDKLLSSLSIFALDDKLQHYSIHDHNLRKIIKNPGYLVKCSKMLAFWYQVIA